MCVAFFFLFSLFFSASFLDLCIKCLVDMAAVAAAAGGGVLETRDSVSSPLSEAQGLLLLVRTSPIALRNTRVVARFVCARQFALGRSLRLTMVLFQ